MQNRYLTIFLNPILAAKIFLKAIKSFHNPINFVFKYFIINKSEMTILLRNNKNFNISEKDRLFINWFLKTNYRIDITEDGEILLCYKEMKLLIRLGKADFFIFHEIFENDTYKLSELNLGCNGNIIDIGANVGYFTCAMLKKSMKVISIEPVKDNFKQALKNISLNNGNSANIINCAVTSGKTGKKIKIYVDKTDRGRSSVSDVAIKELENVEIVDTISLHKIFEDYNLISVDLVKCDVEGAEYDIFLNTPVQIIKKIKKIVMEIHVNEKWQVSNLENLIEYFSNAGFNVKCDIGKELASKSMRFVSILEASQVKCVNRELNPCCLRV